MLFRLAYYSTNNLKKTTHPQKSELKKIITAARTTNRVAGITGGLMFNRSYFAQVLEGDRTAVSDLFCRIAKDPRHSSIVIIEAGPVGHRLFDRWAMGLAEKTGIADMLNAKFGHSDGFDPTKMKAADFVSYILQMVTLEQKLISVTVPTWVADRTAADFMEV